MSPVLAEAIDIATDLAWWPLGNLNGLAYVERKELHRRLVDLSPRIRLSANAAPELRCLVTAIERVARASFANRWGPMYWSRRQAVLELRGALDVYGRGL